jgi:hypothetical protein
MTDSPADLRSGGTQVRVKMPAAALPILLRSREQNPYGLIQTDRACLINRTRHQIIKCCHPRIYPR